MYEPTTIDHAFGLAALGRRVALARPGAERMRDFHDIAHRAVGPTRNEWAIRSGGLCMAFSHSSGGGVFVFSSRLLPDGIRGLEFHHALGLECLSSDEAALVRSRVRLEVEGV